MPNKITLSQMQKSMLMHSSRYSDQKLLRILNPEFKPPEETYEITKNQIIVGYKSTDFSKENVVTIDIKKFSDTGETYTFSAVFLGQQGSGKSVFAGIIFLDNLVYRMDMVLYGHDLKGEWSRHNEPYGFDRPLSFRENIDQIVYRPLGMERRPYDILLISPLFVGKNKNIHKYFAIGYWEIKRVAKYDTIEAIRLLIELLSLDPMNEDLLDLLRDSMSNDSIESFKDLRIEIRRVDRKNKKEKDKLSSTAHRLLRKIDSAMASNNKIISDDPEDWVDVLKEMKERQGKGGVFFKGRLRAGGRNIYIDAPFEAMLKLHISEIINDSMGYYIYGNRDSILKTEPAILLDEIDVLASEQFESSTKNFIRNLITKGRQAHLNLGIIGQEASLIDRELFSQVKVIFTSRVTPNNLKVLVDRNLDKDVVQSELMSLSKKVKTNVGTEPSEWAVITEENEIIKVVPISPCSDNQHS